MTRPPTYIGCAGWSLPRASRHEFPAEGSQLVRYAVRFNAVEINSSFYRPHRHATYARWAASVPDAFAFSVKMPRQITHELRLVGTSDALARFASEVSGLGAKLQCVLIQLPPSLAFDDNVAPEFLAACKDLLMAPTVVEARHASWFGDDATRLLTGWRVGRVHADPPAVAQTVVDTAPIRYHRMHGSPVIYRSSYEPAALTDLALTLGAAAAGGMTSWCIFDNTTFGHATSNALALQARVSAAAR